MPAAEAESSSHVLEKTLAAPSIVLAPSLDAVEQAEWTREHDDSKVDAYASR
jgi:hypothetical protein